MRPDLPLGLLAAQVAHAAAESGPAKPGTHAVVLAATPLELQELLGRLIAAGVPHAQIVESDAPYTDQLMAVGIAPAPRDSVRRFVSALPLLRESQGGVPTAVAV